jgi:GNAT superfamily N-acetyltransferase
MTSSITIRVARRDDEPALRELIPRSARALSGGYYTAEQIEAAIRYVFGVDSTLIEDGTYFVVECAEVISGSGGWSKRRTLYGGDQYKRTADPLLDPASDAARIRAFFVAPGYARRGIGRRLMETCARAAYEAGFRQLELMATLPGVPLYAAFGFTSHEEKVEQTPEGVSIPFVRMHRRLDSPVL